MGPATSLFIAFAGAFSLVLAAGALLQRYTSAAPLQRAVRATTYFSLGILFLHYGIIFAGLEAQFPHILFLHAPVLAILGPLLLFFFTGQAGLFAVRPAIIALHFLPGAVVSAALAPLLLSSGQAKLDVFSGAGMSSGYGLIAGAGYHLNLLSVPLSIYFAAIIFRFRFLLKADYRSRSQYSASLFVLALVILAEGFATAAWLTTEMVLLEACYLVGSIAIITSDLIGRRYPELLDSVTTTADRQKRSRLQSLDAQRLALELEALMREERLYCDEDLSLGRLAAHIQISDAQLSELINTKFGCNFNSYVNGYRVEAACAILLAEPRKSVLNVALEVGFNSSSVFHSAFRATKGLTPGQFRQLSRKT